jgi:tetratricopeptide (TPR) repeat protein
MITIRTLGSFLAAFVLFAASARAENGMLVVHVIDIHEQPLPGVSLRAGAGSSVARVDSFGEARIQLAPNTRPGDSVFIELVAGPRDLVFISPLNKWTAVPSFDEKPTNVVQVVLVKRGDRAMLENGIAARAMANAVTKNDPNKASDGQNPLNEVAREYGLRPEEVDLAIRNWGKQTTNSSEKGLSELYAHQYPEAVKDLQDSLQEQKDAEKVVKIKVAEGAALLGRALREEGRYAEAVAAYKEAVEANPRNGTYLFSLAFTMFDNNDPKQAEALSAKALELDKARLTDDDSELAYSYYAAGAIFVNQHKYAAAEPYFRKAVDTIEKSLGPDSPQLIRYLVNLAMVYSAQGRTADYGPLIKRAHDIQKQSLSPDDPENTYATDKLADFYMAEGRYLEADALLQQSMSILRAYFKQNAHQDMPREFGEMAVETLNTLVFERHLRGIANKDDESLLQEALMFQRLLTGDKSVETAGRHERLADLLREQGRYPEAEKEYRQAVEIRGDQKLPATINLKGKLAYDLAAQGRYSEAENEANEAVRIAKAAPGAVELILSADNDLADLYMSEHKPTDAETALKDALSQPHPSHNDLEPGRIESANRLASIYTDQR